MKRALQRVRWAATLGLVAAAMAGAPPSWLGFVVIGLVALGAAHGAVDHVVAAATRRPPASTARFVAGYLAWVVLAGLLWMVVPVLTLVAFLVGSAWHFGRGDFAELPPGRATSHAVWWSRGAAVVFAPLAIHLDAVAPILGAMGTPVPPTLWAWAPAVAAVLPIVHVASLVEVGLAPGRPVVHLPRAVGDALVLAAAAWLLPPLAFFAVYFVLWHAAAHVEEVHPLLRAPLPLRARALALGFGLGGVGAVLVLSFAAPSSPEGWARVFQLLAALTLPHALWLERWRAMSPLGLQTPLRATARPRGVPRSRSLGGLHVHDPTST